MRTDILFQLSEPVDVQRSLRPTDATSTLDGGPSFDAHLLSSLGQDTGRADRNRPSAPSSRSTFAGRPDQTEAPKRLHSPVEHRDCTQRPAERPSHTSDDRETTTAKQTPDKVPHPRADDGTARRYDEDPNDGPVDDAASTVDHSDDTDQGAQESRVDVTPLVADAGALLPISTAPAGSAEPVPLQDGDEVSLDVASAWSVGQLPQETITGADAGPVAPQPQQDVSPHGVPTEGGEVVLAGGQMPAGLSIDATRNGVPAPGTARGFAPPSQVGDAGPTTRPASMEVSATDGTPEHPTPTTGNSPASDTRSAAVSAPVGTSGALSLAGSPETAAPKANESSQASAPAAPADSDERPTAHAVTTNPPSTTTPPPTKPRTTIAGTADANAEDTTPVPQIASIGEDDASPGTHDSVASDGNVRLPLAHSSVSAAAMPAKTPAPSAPSLPIQEQVAAQVVRAAHDGVSRLHLALEPGSLGKLDISLEIHRDGRVSAMITADNPQTLEALRGESKALTQSLNNAGLKADQNSINFGFRASDGGAGGNHTGGNGQGRFPAEPASVRESGAAGIHDPLEVMPWPSTRRIAGAGRLDIHA